MPPISPLPLVWQKRAFDIGASALLLVVTAPLFIAFGLCIFLEHTLRGRPGEALLYADTRISRGKKFSLYKFNIFDPRAVADLRARGQFIHTKKLEKNGQLIVVGKVLKQIYLDELPQLYNVLRGDMSLVGPRPVNEEVFADMQKQGTPPQALIQGGMTGNFQSYKDTRGHTSAGLEAAYLRIYRERSGWLLVLVDLKIIVRTLKVLLRAKGV